MVTREKFRSFLARREAAKHAKYDGDCKAATWSFKAMAFGTWGGLGPERSKLLHRLVKRAAGWLEGDFRARRQEEIQMLIGAAVMRHQAKNFLF